MGSNASSSGNNMCCAAICKTPKIHAGIGALAAFLVLGMGFFVCSAMTAVTDNLLCMIYVFNNILDAADQPPVLPPDVMDEVTGYFGLLSIAAIIPAVLIFLFNLIAAAGTFKEIKGITMCGVCLSILFGIVGVVVYAIFFILGNSLDQIDQALNGEISKFFYSCEYDLPQWKAEVDEVTTAYNDFRTHMGTVMRPSRSRLRPQTTCWMNIRKCATARTRSWPLSRPSQPLR